MCRVKEITKKLYKNIKNLILIWYKIDTVFMNSENSKSSDPYKFALSIADKIDL